ncbi:MAG: glycoside hydrolase family 3 N-terminal domain-containing protein, partial [Synechococcus sp.]
LCCAKHFPGHGDTSTDSHLALPMLPHSRERLEAIELPPFRQAIAAGVAAVMTAHLQLPALAPHLPATLSAPVLTDLLRRDLGFGGLVVTDALVMEAIAGRHGGGEAAVLALEAGADLVLMPEDAGAAITAIVAAVEQGRLSRARLEASRQRRRRALASLPSAEGTEPSDPARPLGALTAGPQPEHRRLAEELVQAGLRQRGGPITPLRAGAPEGLNLVRIDNALQCPALPLGAPALALPAAAGFRPCLLEPRSPSPWSGAAAPPLALERLGAGPVLLQLFLRGNPFSGGAAAEPWAEAIRQLQGAGRLAGLVVYGSPYLWEELEPLLEASTPAAWVSAQTPLAQAVALGALGIGAEAGTGAFTD